MPFRLAPISTLKRRLTICSRCTAGPTWCGRLHSYRYAILQPAYGHAAHRLWWSC